MGDNDKHQGIVIQVSRTGHGQSKRKQKPGRLLRSIRTSSTGVTALLSSTTAVRALQKACIRTALDAGVLALATSIFGAAFV